MAPKINKKIAVAVKALVSIGILYALFSKAGIFKVFALFKTINIYYFAAAALLYVVSLYVSSLRLRLILENRFGVYKLFCINMIGAFFNNVLPGSTGGDAVKLYYVYRHTGDGVLAAGSVFLDRYVGFFTLLVIGFTASIMGFTKLSGTGVEYLMPFFIVSFVAGSYFVFGLRIGRRFMFVRKFHDYFRIYIGRFRLIRNTIAISIAVQITCIVCVYCVSKSLGAAVAFRDMLTFVPIVIVIASIPISISGLGVREGAFVLLFRLIGVKEDMAMAISFLWFLSYSIPSTLGLYYYFRYKPTLQKAEMETSET